ncbi:MAG: hypothetical protein RI893_593 [Pseudomonadota bacterium]
MPRPAQGHLILLTPTLSSRSISIYTSTRSFSLEGEGAYSGSLTRPACLGLTEYFMFYNEERRHQSLGYKTPSVVYQTATGGGAKIVDKYGATEASVPV